MIDPFHAIRDAFRFDDDADPRTSRPACEVLAALTDGLPLASFVGVRPAAAAFLQLAGMIGLSGYALLSMVSDSPSLAVLPERFIAVFHDRDGGPMRGPHGHDYGTVERIVGTAGAVVFTIGSADDEAILAGLAEAESRGCSLVIVDTDRGYLGRWVDTIRDMRPDMTPLAVGAFAPPASIR